MINLITNIALWLFTLFTLKNESKKIKEKIEIESERIRNEKSKPKRNKKKYSDVPKRKYCLLCKGAFEGSREVIYCSDCANKIFDKQPNKN